MAKIKHQQKLDVLHAQCEREDDAVCEIVYEILEALGCVSVHESFDVKVEPHATCDERFPDDVAINVYPQSPWISHQENARKIGSLREKIKEAGFELRELSPYERDYYFQDQIRFSLGDDNFMKRLTSLKSGLLPQASAQAEHISQGQPKDQESNKSSAR